MSPNSFNRHQSLLPKWMCIFILIFMSLFVSQMMPSSVCAQTGCPLAPVTHVQPYPSTLISSFDQAGINALGVNGPALPQIYSGRDNPHLVRPYVPCVLLKAIGWVESTGWKQFDAPYGQFGNTIIAPDCGYGIMQITSGMSGGADADFEPPRVVSSPDYNIGTGAKFLIEKWNSNIPSIGDNNPSIIEEWYYAVWASIPSPIIQ